MIHTRAIVPVLEADDERCIATSRAPCHHAVSTDYGITLEFGNLLHLFLNFLDNLLCFMQGATLGGTHLGKEHALVFLRNEARWQRAHEEDE